MNKVFKYPLVTGNGARITHTMPEGAEVLCVMMQEGYPYMWAKVRKVNPLETRTFLCVGTGHDFEWGYNYIDTVEDKPYIWHYFEELSV